MKVLCIGEAMIELRIDPAGQTAAVGVSGDVLNTAVALRRLAPPGVRVGLVSALGTEPMSRRIAAFVAAQGLETAGIRTVPDRSAGLYAISVDAAGERSFGYWRSASAARVMFGPDAAPDFTALDAADLVHLSAITLAILSPVVRMALLDDLDRRRRGGLRLSFDSNHRPALWDTPQAARQAVARAWEMADIGFPSIDDEMALFDQDEAAAIARLRGAGQGVMVLKRGARGPVLLRPATGEVVWPAAPTVVDTTGAGDAFNGAFLAHWLAHPDDLTGALRAGHDTALRVIGVPGAILPDWIADQPGGDSR